MRYCTFCRDGFEDDPDVCPRCGGELVENVPEPDDSGADTDSPQAASVNFVPVLFVEREEDLRAAVEVLGEYGVNFEIDESKASAQMPAGTLMRAWRLLVPEDEATEAFMWLVKALPDLFPCEVSQAVRDESAASDPSVLAAEKVVDMLKSPLAPGPELAASIITALAGDDAEAVITAKAALARKGAPVAPLLVEIVAQSIAEGGEGAERVLYNSAEVLEALGDAALLPRLEPLFVSTNAAVRARAVYAAGRLGAPQAVDSLIDMLADPDEDVRYEASEAVWRVTGLDFEFDPYRPADYEREHVAAIRDAWEASGKKARVRSSVNLADLLRILAGEE